MNHFSLSDDRMAGVPARLHNPADLPRTDVCEKCGERARTVTHWHDPQWCSGVDCGGILCDNCAEAEATK